MSIFNEVSNKQIIGEVRDIIRYEDGRVIDTGWSRNSILTKVNTLIACLLKGETGIEGIQYWSIGSGEETWDLPSVFEKAELVINAGASANGTVTVTLDGQGKVVNVNLGDDAETVAGKIRSTGFEGWNTSGTGNKVIFTATTDGNKVDALYNAGATGAVGNMTTIVQGVKGIPRPEPQESDLGCVNEFYRKKIKPEDITFVDNAGIETQTPTNRLQISVTFLPEEAVGNWREFSIVGGNATEVLGTGYPINYKTHGLIEKTDTMTVERKIRFTFR